MDKIFISYKRQDKVLPVVEEIKQKTGVDCRIYREDIVHDTSLVYCLIDKIKGCELFLLMYSSSYIGIDYDGDWNMRELNYAIKQRKCVIFVSLDSTPFSEIIKFLYGQYLKFDCTTKDGKNRLIQWTLNSGDAVLVVYSIVNKQVIFNISIYSCHYEGLCPKLSTNW